MQIGGFPQSAEQSVFHQVRFHSHKTEGGQGEFRNPPGRPHRSCCFPLGFLPSSPAPATVSGAAAMGVKNLWDILDSCKKKLPLQHLEWVDPQRLYPLPKSNPIQSLLVVLITMLLFLVESGTRRCAWIFPAGSCSSVAPIAPRHSSRTRSTSRTSSTASEPSSLSTAASSSSQVLFSSFSLPPPSRF